MRYKFRVWDTYSKEMKLPTLLRLSRSLPFTDDNNNGKVNQIQCNGENHIEYFGDSYILMQYTGLKDKHGKEIYEGDIVDLDCHSTDGDYGEYYNNFKGIFKVEYDEDIAGFELTQIKGNVEGWYLSVDSVKDLTIIGNIHSNPELLEVKPNV